MKAPDFKPPPSADVLRAPRGPYFRSATGVSTSYPVLTSFRPALPLQRTEITAFDEDYQRTVPPRGIRSAAVPRLSNSCGSSQRQVIHNPSDTAIRRGVSSRRPTYNPDGPGFLIPALRPRPLHPKPVHPVRDRYIDGSVQKRPAFAPLGPHPRTATTRIKYVD